MSETLLSPGSDHEDENQRPIGRSFLSVAQNTMEHSTLPDAPQVPLDGVPFDFATWRKDHYRTRWAETRDDLARVAVKNEVL